MKTRQKVYAALLTVAMIGNFSAPKSILAAPLTKQDPCASVVAAFAKGLKLAGRAERVDLQLESETDSREYSIRVRWAAASDLYRLMLSNDSHDGCAFEELSLIQSGE